MTQTAKKTKKLQSVSPDHSFTSEITLDQPNSLESTGPSFSKPTGQSQPKKQTFVSSTPTVDTCRGCRADLQPGFRYCGVCGQSVQNISLTEQEYQDPLIGALIGERYRVISRLGAGGMGAVYKVEHIQIGKIAAMKILHGDLSRKDSMIRRFNREARAVSKLTSPYTVSIFDYGRSAGLVYIVMEFLQGKDLADLLSEVGPLSPRRINQFVKQIANSLDDAHRYGIIHRDLKPENLFLVRDKHGKGEHIKVVDFGLAKVIEKNEESFDETKAGTILGTPYYMSPEQIRGDPVDARTDIYSLGAVIYRLCTGQPPFRAENTIGLLQKHLTEPPPKVSATRPNLALFDNIVAKAMAKAQFDRYENVLQLSMDLENAFQDSSTNTGEYSQPIQFSQPIQVENLGTKEEFNHFERNLRFRKTITSFFLFTLLLLFGYFFFWGIILENFTRHRAEKEPNNEISTATQIFINTPIHGFISRGFENDLDQDLFLIRPENQEQEVASVEVTGIPGVDLELTILNSAGMRLLTVNSAGIGQGEHISNLRFPNGIFYVMISANNMNTNHHIPYELFVHYRSSFIGEEYEPNNRANQTRIISNNNRFIGSIGWRGDHDLYGLPRPFGMEVSYKYSLTGVQNLDLQVSLLSALGEVITTHNSGGISEPEDGTFEVNIREHPRPHFLRIEETENRTSDLFYFLQAETTENN